MIKIIAEALRISPNIVNLCRYQLYRKLCVQNDVELAMAEIKMGILEGLLWSKCPKAQKYFICPWFLKVRRQRSRRRNSMWIE